ncbi:MAG: DUF4156 domain-containing protein [Phenylobacterium sp.]|nr:DUF4156 domain-containing protein [Phenylobacterium sp.]
MSMAAACAAMIAGAALAAQATEIIIVKDESSVAGCEYLGEVKGSSAWGGLVTNMAYNRARDGLKKRALALGATHVVLLDSSSGPMGSNTLGNAYKCPTRLPRAD